MNDSQHSDFLSGSTDIFVSTPPDPVNMNTITYDSLLTSTKSTFTTIRKDIKKSTFSVTFSSLLEDCSICVSQGLDLILDLLSKVDINTSKLIGYMEEAVSLLQLLSDLIKYIIESITMSCNKIKPFPTTTGRVIMLVFTHCKESESLYGCQLTKVEKQLKDLFRSCHELQLTYLMVMEKHFIFDLTSTQELQILTEALCINLKIGEIVQSLDVKTMAEQWKAYTMICEKYSTSLNDNTTYRDCSRILCNMIKSNIQTALEDNQEEKVVVRYLKVTNFTLKILLRVTTIFRLAKIKDHDNILDLLLYIHMYNEAYLRTMCEKSLQFVNLFTNNVTGAVNLLLNELVLDDGWLNCICNYAVDEIGKEDKLLGFIMLVVSVMRTIIQRSGDPIMKGQRGALIDVIYNFLPYCHIWFNIGLKIKCESSSRYETYGLSEHLLTHTTALAATMSCEEINALENKMIKTILSNDCCSAIFSANLWVMLTRISPTNFLYHQLVALCTTYQKLDKRLCCAPPKLHLNYTIQVLFKEMVDEDKIKIYNMFPIQDDNNMTLWSCLKVNSLPSEAQWTAEQIVMEKLKRQIERILNGTVAKFDILINTINLASTCSVANRDDEFEDLFIKAWMKVCPKTMQSPTKALDKGNIWYYKYIEALVFLSNSMENTFQGNSGYLVKVLHILSNIIQVCSKEYKLMLINIITQLANTDVFDGNKHVVDNILMQTYRVLFQDTDWGVRNKLFYVVGKKRSNSLDKIITKVVAEEDLHKIWYYYLKYGSLKKNQDIKLKDQLLYTLDLRYFHKCLDYEDLRDCVSITSQKSLSSNNFDFVDIDSLFDTGDAEPACKKQKLNNSDAEAIITRLEQDATLLCKIKENVFNTEYKMRVQNVCNKLSSIVH